MSAMMESLVRRYDAIKPHLSERQRRVWLGSEARELGSGGAGLVADIRGLGWFPFDREHPVRTTGGQVVDVLAWGVPSVGR